jgi:drug/metabolite transporter (DMT)-like permease
MANALKRADTGAVMPLDFSRLVWASLLGFIIFSETPDLWTFIGGGIIVAAASYIIVRESQLSR